MMAAIFDRWEAVALCQRSGDRAPFSRAMTELRRQFERLRQWERARSADFYRAVYLGDKALTVHLSFGTPFAAFRRRLLARVPLPTEKVSGTYVLIFKKKGRAARARPVHLSSLDGTSSATCADLRPSSVPLALLRALCADFYRPMRVPELHERVYPGRHFNPVSGPGCVHQAMARLRRWLSVNRIPLLIEEKNGFYRLAGTRALRIMIPAPGVTPGDEANTAVRGMVERARAAFGDRPFGTGQLSRELGVSSATAFRALRVASRAGWVRGEGRGPARKYRIAA